MIPRGTGIYEYDTRISHVDSGQRISLIKNWETVFQACEKTVFTGQKSGAVPADGFSASQVDPLIHGNGALGKLQIRIQRQNIVVINGRIESEVENGFLKLMRLEHAKPLHSGLKIKTGSWVKWPISGIKSGEALEKSDIVHMRL